MKNKELVSEKSFVFFVPKNKDLFGNDFSTDKSDIVSGHPNLGVAYLTSFLKSYGMNVHIYDDALEDDIGVFEEIVNSTKPTMIGITGFSYSYKYLVDAINSSYEITKKLGIPIVVGGPHVSATGSEILLNTNATFAVKGEGENTLLELIQLYSNERNDYSSVDGLLWKDKFFGVKENQDREWIRDLDALPYPDFDAFKLERYSYTLLGKMPVISSRGCPYKCTFCSVKLSMGRNFRRRSPENFVGEMNYWYERGYDKFEFNDDCFSTNMKHSLNICNEMINRFQKRGKDISYEIYNGIRVDRVTPELINKMKESGCTLISYGVESGCQEILDYIKKGITLEQVRQAVKWSNEAGIDNSLNFIIGHQGETMKTALETLKFANSVDTSFVNFYNLIPYPGTDTYDWVMEHGKMLVPPESYLFNISYRDNLPIFETDDFTKSERIIVTKKGFRLYEKKILRYRLGSVLGRIAYIIMGIRPLARLGVSFFLYNKLGIYMYDFMKSFEMSSRVIEVPQPDSHNDSSTSLGTQDHTRIKAITKDFPSPKVAENQVISAHKVEIS